MSTTVVHTRVTTRVAKAPYVVAGALFAVYAAWSVLRHLRWRTSGYDLGIFEQAVRGYAGFGAPVATIKGPGFNLLGDHFHPILMLLAPLYRVFPSPITLLVAQAGLFAVSAVPITRLAGWAVGVAYGLSWGLQSAVDFDFHEVTFAVPMLAFGLVAVVERRWGAAVAWTLPMILVKEDLPATVAVIGVLIAFRGRRRLGLAVIGVAVVSGLLIVGVVLPALNPAHVYAYAASTGFDGQSPWHRLLFPGVKMRTLVWVLAPTLFLSLRSPVLLVALPTVAWRFWSTNPSYWGTGFQYSAVLMPIVFVAFIDGVPAALVRRVGYFACVIAVLLPGPLLRGEWGTDFGRTNVLSTVPDGVRVAADNRLAPQLTARCTVYFFPAYPQGDVLPEWVAVSDPPDTSMAAPVTMADAVDRLPGLGYQVVRHSDGVVILRRP